MGNYTHFTTGNTFIFTYQEYKIKGTICLQVGNKLAMISVIPVLSVYKHKLTHQEWQDEWGIGVLKKIFNLSTNEKPWQPSWK
jgi:hypothetical protein